MLMHIPDDASLSLSETSEKLHFMKRFSWKFITPQTAEDFANRYNLNLYNLIMFLSFGLAIW